MVHQHKLSSQKSLSLSLYPLPHPLPFPSLPLARHYCLSECIPIWSRGNDLKITFVLLLDYEPDTWENAVVVSALWKLRNKYEHFLVKKF